MVTHYKEKYQLLAGDGSFSSFTRNRYDPDFYFVSDGKTTNGYNQIHVVIFYDTLCEIADTEQVEKLLEIFCDKGY